MAIRKILTRAIDSTAASANLNFDAGTLFVDSTNNRVGINQTSPALPLHVSASTENLALFQNSNNSPALVRFREPATTQDPYIAAYGNAMAFGKYGGAETMRIDASGNIAINTSSNPLTARLFVSGTDNNNLIASYNTAAGNAGIRIQANQAGLYLQGSGTVDPLYITNSSATGYTSFRPSSDTERMRITSGGNVGIGTSSPTTGLVLAFPYSIDTTGAPSKWTSLFRDTSAMALGVGGSLLFQGLKSSGGAVGNYGGIAGLKENGNDGNEQGYLALFSVPASGIITERMRITSGGNVGIGTTSPSRLLDVNGQSLFRGDTLILGGVSGTNADGNVMISATGNAVYANLQFGSNSGSTVGPYFTSAGNALFSFAHTYHVTPKSVGTGGSWAVETDGYNPILNIPFTNSIRDYWQMEGGTSGSNLVSLKALGTDTNVSMSIQPKGTGAVIIGSSTYPTNANASQAGRLIVSGSSGGGFGSMHSAAAGATTYFYCQNNFAYRVTIFSTGSSVSAQIGVYIFVGLNKGAGVNPVVLTVATTGSPGWSFGYSLSGSNDTLVAVNASADNQGTRAIVEQLGNYG